MKQNIKLLFGTALLGLASCSINSWNDQLDGFEGNQAPTNNQAIEYTLTATDYASIAANSTNIGLAGDNLSQLKAVGTQQSFNSIITAKEYVPAFLSDPKFSYFTLTDGSAVKLTYNVTVGASPEIAEIQGASQFKITTDFYQDLVWESNTDYVNSFAPSKPASKYLPTILSDQFDEAVEGDYVLVNYETSAQEPVFGSVTPDPTPTFTPTSVISTVALDNTYDIKGIVTGICTSGYILTDNSGSIFVYYKTFDVTSVAIGDQLSVSGTVGAYNKGFQLTGTSVVSEKVGTQAYTYPTPAVLDGTKLDEVITRTDNQIATYVQLNGDVLVSGNNINIVVDGAATAKGSGYYVTDEIKEQLVDGAKVSVNGYLIAIAGGKYCNLVITKVTAVASGSPFRKVAAKSTVVVPTTSENAIYTYNGTTWAPVADAIALNPADYTAMGQSNNNLTSAATLLPTFLRVKFPYATAETSKFVVYVSNSNITCDQYTFDGTTWNKENGIATESAQFVKNKGSWMYNPNVNVILPAGKGQELSTKFYQACVDWVFENIDKPLGSADIKGGQYYISKYGNNEYYCGTSAYQGNVDIRASAAKTQYAAGYADMTDEEIVETMKLRFCTEVMPGALSTLYPDATPIDGLEVLYTINFGAYTGSTTTYDIVFKVVDKGKFEPVSCTWYEDGVIPTK